MRQERFLKSKKEREWDQNNQQVSDEELILSAKPEPNYCSEQAPVGFTFQRSALITRHTIWSNEYIIVYSKCNRSNRRKTHLGKSRHSSRINPCYRSGRGGMPVPFSHTLGKYYDDCESSSFHFTHFPQENLWEKISAKVEVEKKEDTSKKLVMNVLHPTFTLPSVIYRQR